MISEQQIKEIVINFLSLTNNILFFDKKTHDAVVNEVTSACLDLLKNKQIDENNLINFINYYVMSRY